MEDKTYVTYVVCKECRTAQHIEAFDPEARLDYAETLIFNHHTQTGHEAHWERGLVAIKTINEKGYQINALEK